MSLLGAVKSILGSGSENTTYDIFSYQTILKDLRNFKQAGGTQSSDFNNLDTPTRKYFRLMFHFFNGNEASSTGDGTENAGGGLLHPTWIGLSNDSGITSQSVSQNVLSSLVGSSNASNTETYEKPTGDDISEHDVWVSDPKVPSRAQELIWWRYSSAYSYLMMNNELERAQNCRAFIELLSNINTYSPWYFQSINGLSEALSRKTTGETISVDERKKISINCLEDAVDNRIATLLDLYRSFTWSWRTHRSILPSNLKKFDMTIAIIEAPIKGLHHPREKLKLTDALGALGEWLNVDDDDFAVFDLVRQDRYITSYKMYELHNCEIDYNSSTTGLETIDNTEGWEPKYKIDILFDDVVEYSYNEFLQGFSEFGDLVKSDTTLTNYTDNKHLDSPNMTYESEASDSAKKSLKNNQNNTLEERLDNTSGVLEQAEGALINYASTKLNSKADDIILGNLFGISVARIGEELSSALTNTSNIVSTATRIYSETTNFNGFHSAKKGDLRNITEDDASKLSAIKNVSDIGNIFSDSVVVSNI